MKNGDLHALDTPTTINLGGVAPVDFLSSVHLPFRLQGESG